MARKSNAEPWDAWTLPDFAVTEDTATIVPYTCDEMVSAAAKFINTGISLQNTDNIRVIRLVGDATHDETWQKLKILRIGFAARHFTDGSWKATFLPVLECLCHDETKDVVDICLQALIHIFQTRHGINLVDVILECFWDGRIEAMEMLKKHFPLALIIFVWNTPSGMWPSVTTTQDSSTS